MQYLPEFPEDSRARVDAAIAKAERDFLRGKKSLEISHSDYESAVEGLVGRYVTSVLFAFVNETIQIAKRGILPANRIQIDVKKFFEGLISEAENDKCYYDGIRIRFMRPLGAPDFHSAVWDDIRGSDRWLAFVEEVAEIAEAQATIASSNSTPCEKVIDGHKITWEDIKIELLSEERIQVTTPGLIETLNYAEFGFKDGRNEKPNQAWITLRSLAENRGTLKQPTNERQRWSDVEKRMQEIRRVFRKHFNLTEDPLPFVKSIGYRSRFWIGCPRSYDT